ncbi:MAG TPA: hypothetical protein VKT53_08255 [Candidatus Acidoferrum sp.]|nr:hypothetical protein [Candidatus Acidoferrum sp.]
MPTPTWLEPAVIAAIITNSVALLTFFGRDIVLERKRRQWETDTQKEIAEFKEKLNRENLAFVDAAAAEKAKSQLRSKWLDDFWIEVVRAEAAAGPLTVRSAQPSEADRIRALTNSLHGMYPFFRLSAKAANERALNPTDTEVINHVEQALVRMLLHLDVDRDDDSHFTQLKDDYEGFRSSMKLLRVHLDGKKIKAAGAV